MPDEKLQLNVDSRGILEDLYRESLEREKEFVRSEKSLRTRIMLVLGRARVVAPLTSIRSPTGRKSKMGEIMKNCEQII